jgi:hypothetical protein
VNLSGVNRDLETAGFNLTGTLPAAEYDATVPGPWRIEETCPGARGILVVGNAGKALWPRFRSSPEAALRSNPLDRYTARILREVTSRFGEPRGFALYTEKRQDRYLPLVPLARRAGFGSPGRVGVLLHPLYGPWISIRGVLFIPDEVPIREAPPFDPCTGCPAPCADACHGGAVSEGGLEVTRCFRAKILKSPCRTACDARSACIVGPEHAFPRDQIAHHSRIRWRPGMIRRAAGVLLARAR